MENMIVYMYIKLKQYETHDVIFVSFLLLQLQITAYLLLTLKQLEKLHHIQNICT